MTPQIVAAGMSFVLTALAVYLLICYGGMYNLAERLGHGIAGSSFFLSGFKQLGLLYVVAPFDPSYQVWWRVGLLLLLGGKAYRLRKHTRANKLMNKQAKAYFASKALVP